MTLQDKSLHDATMRYAAERICLWRLCGNMGCLRARTCKGNVRHCTSLMVGWIEAMEEEKQRVRGNFAALEDEIKTFEQLRVYLAWRGALDRARETAKADSAKTERDRRELMRLIENRCKTWEREEALRKEREAAERDSARPRAGDAPSRLRDGDPAGGDPEVKNDDSEFDPGFPLTRE